MPIIITITDGEGGTIQPGPLSAATDVSDANPQPGQFLQYQGGGGGGAPTLFSIPPAPFPLEVAPTDSFTLTVDGQECTFQSVDTFTLDGLGEYSNAIFFDGVNSRQANLVHLPNLHNLMLEVTGSWTTVALPSAGYLTDLGFQANSTLENTPPSAGQWTPVYLSPGSINAPDMGQLNDLQTQVNELQARIDALES